MELKITKIYRSDRAKDGTPLVGKNGKPYSKIGIKTVEHGDAWISGFGNAENANWQVGDIIHAEVERVGTYLNLKRPDPFKDIEQRLAAIEKWIADHAEPVDYTK